MFVCYLNYLPCESDSKNIVFLFHTSNPLNFFHPHSQDGRSSDVFLLWGLVCFEKGNINIHQKKGNWNLPSLVATCHMLLFWDLSKTFPEESILSLWLKTADLRWKESQVCLDGEVKPCTGVLSGCRKWHSCLTCLFCGALCQFTSHAVTHCGTQETSRDWSLGGVPVETEGKIIPSVTGRSLLGPDILSEQGFDLSPNFPACLSSDLPRCRSFVCQKEKNKYHILKHICGI